MIFAPREARSSLRERVGAKLKFHDLGLCPFAAFDMEGVFMRWLACDETARVDPQAKKIRPRDLVDRRYLDGLEKSGFFDKLWASK